MVSTIEIISYLGILILCIVAFVQVSRGYQVSEKKLAAYDIIDFAKILLLTFGFIIIKLTVDYVQVLGYMSKKVYTGVSITITVIILVGILYSVKLLIDLTKKAQ